MHTRQTLHLDEAKSAVAHIRSFFRIPLFINAVSLTSQKHHHTYDYLLVGPAGKTSGWEWKVLVIRSNRLLGRRPLCVIVTERLREDAT